MPEDLAPWPKEPEELAPDPRRRPPLTDPEKIVSLYQGVRRWQGRIHITRQSTRFFDDGLNHEDAHSDYSASATVMLEQSATDPGSWKAVDSRINGTSYFHSLDINYPHNERTTVTYRGNYVGLAASPPDIQLIINVRREEGRRTPQWSVFIGGKLASTYVVNQEVKYVNRPGYVDFTSQKPSDYWPHTGVDAPLAGPVRQAGVLHRTATVLKRSADPHGSTDLRVSTITLTPVYDDVEVEVEITGVGRGGAQVAYEKWVPAGTLSGAAGSRLTITARLKARDGRPLRVELEDFTFQLNDTSREPGVCMNFPLNATPAGDKPATPDLKFTAAGGETSPLRQQKRMRPSADGEGRPFAETQIECFDWGAWSDLSVTATLADGREIAGHLKGDPSAINILLPKRGAGSHIADAWKETHSVAAVDNDDGEKIPCGGKADGDGFTLYEEYRGFAEDGHHIEGDPERIDFFVRNYIGSDARPGIELFEDLTGVLVHQKLRSSEFDREKRLMNGNHAEVAHRVDQHGVQMQTIAGTTGAVAVFNQAGVRGRPKLCIGIDVQPREADTAVTTSVNVPVSDLIFAYDRAILHELLHVVGVEHHGAGDGRALFRFVFADDSENTSGKPYFSLHSDRVGITDESTLRDLAEEFEGDLSLLREKLRTELFPGMKAAAVQGLEERKGYDIKFTADELAERSFENTVDILFTFNWYVGARNGQCSGDERCAMRYYFAKLYEKQGAAKAFYFIRDEHTERAGMELCRAVNGTGINTPGRKPQPRYGDAKTGGGNCASWIVFNDAIPPGPAL